MIYQYKIKKRLSDADIFAVRRLATGNWQLEDSLLMEEVEELVRSGRSVGEGQWVKVSG